MAARGARVLGTGCVTSRRGWADQVLAAVGTEREDRTFRALARVLHPDTGGDERLMRELLAARERRNSSRR